MPDPVLFGLGAFVTAIAGWAVWCIGQIDEEERQSDRRAKQRDDGAR